jgi:hypothetical protein
MKQVAIAVFSAALCCMSLEAAAQKQTRPADQPGHSESAPGQQARKPGGAKEYAPGQMRKEEDKKAPGASEYAPGQQPKSQQTKKAK